jgi:hypothetical protein
MIGWKCPGCEKRYLFLSKAAKGCINGVLCSAIDQAIRHGINLGRLLPSGAFATSPEEIAAMLQQMGQRPSGEGPN